jgi:hypothetical protein
MGECRDPAESWDIIPQKSDPLGSGDKTLHASIYFFKTLLARMQISSEEI